MNARPESLSGPAATTEEHPGAPRPVITVKRDRLAAGHVPRLSLEPESIIAFCQKVSGHALDAQQRDLAREASLAVASRELVSMDALLHAWAGVDELHHFVAALERGPVVPRPEREISRAPALDPMHHPKTISDDPDSVTDAPLQCKRAEIKRRPPWFQHEHVLESLKTRDVISYYGPAARRFVREFYQVYRVLIRDREPSRIEARTAWIDEMQARVDQACEEVAPLPDRLLGEGTIIEVSTCLPQMDRILSILQRADRVFATRRIAGQSDFRRTNVNLLQPIRWLKNPELDVAISGCPILTDTRFIIPRDPDADENEEEEDE